MTRSSLSPVAAFDISDGVSHPVSESWPRPQVADGYRWLHLDLAAAETARWVHEHLPPISAHALTQAETRPRCDRHEDGLILNLRGVNLNPDSSPEDMVSLRMWITAKAVVSARMRKVWAADEIRVQAEAGTAPDSVGAFLVALVVGLTSRIETVSLDLEERTDALEDQVFDGDRPDPAVLAGLRQAVIKMRRFIHPQREAVVALSQIEDWVIGREERAQLHESANRTRRIVEELDATRERLQALQDQLEAERAQALSRHSQILSVVAAIFLPLGFLTGLFGVNVAGMPGIDNAAAFWWLAGISLVLGLGLFLIFKIADWL